ncbi:MAG TPA: carboxypeptidase regulatory-like domain-containing protein [Terriglobales bacterium]
MTSLLALFLMFAAPDVPRPVIRLSAGSQLRLPAENVTAAYSLDADCADANIVGNVITVIGRRPCSTHLVTISGEKVIETEIIVSPRRGYLASRARRNSPELQESGSLTTSYSSLPAQVETAVRLTRVEGKRQTDIALEVGHGHAFSATEANTTLPYGSISFSGPDSSLTLLDQTIGDSPLMMDNTVLRGLHIRKKNWFANAGVASMTGFRQDLFESDPDRAFATGYHFAAGRNGTLTPAFTWITASRQYLSGKSGGIGSLAYEFRQQDRVHFLADLGISRGAGLAALLDINKESDIAHLNFRAAQSGFARLSSSPAPGLQAEGYWTHRINDRYTLEAAGSQDKYLLLDQTSQTNTGWNTSLRRKLFDRFTIRGGLSGSRLARQADSPIFTTSVPASLSFESRRFGNSFEYRYGRNNASELGSHSVRDTMRLSAGPFTIMGFFSRQSETPTVDYVLDNVPWLRQALLDAGISATTPEQIEDLLRTNADLISAGLLRNVSINISPLRTQVGGSASWASPHRLLSARVESRYDRNNRLQGRVTSSSHDARLSVKVNRQTDLTLQGSLFTTRGSQLGSLNVPVFSITLHRQFMNVPDFFGPYPTGVIHGRVFDDEDGRGMDPNTQKGMADVVILLDGTRRTKTRASGSFTFHGVPSGRHTVEVVYEDTLNHVFTTPPNVAVSDENSEVYFGIGRRKSMIFGTVTDDAGAPIEGVLLRAVGTNIETARSNSSGDFSFANLHPGTFEVAIDEQSVPAMYSLANLHSMNISTEPNQPGKVAFMIPAMRGARGKIVCHSEPVNSANAQLSLDGVDVSDSIQGDGEFSLRELSAGKHELTVRYGSGPLVQRNLDLQRGTAIAVSAPIEVCPK